MVISVVILAIIGFVLSVYALYVDLRVGKDKNYKAVCDINNRVSCSKAFKSKYGKIFGIPNSIIGIIFYLIVLLFAYFNSIYVFYLSVLSILLSIYLAYLLYFKLKDFCLVCNALYLVNLLILIFSYFELY